MRIYDLIEKKKHGGELTTEEIEYMISGYVAGDIPDYQMSAMLMAIWFMGMTAKETLDMTMAMERSGEVMDLSSIPGIKVDKHSTGGVGDKTTLILAPVVAACGGVVAKMSGRGLGHTGGTIDKLEAIPGFQTSIPPEEFFRLVREHGLAVVGQTGNMVPADKKLYALRDVTATVDCIPLIASSVMSKKLAAGSDAILLDVTTGSGAFMKTVDHAVDLARQMVNIGNGAGRRTEAVITNMDIPLGFCIGNALEVREAISVLQGHGPEDLTQVCRVLASHMLMLSGKGDENVCLAMVDSALSEGTALAKLAEMVEAQGGEPEAVFHPEKLAIAPIQKEVIAESSGYVVHMDTEGIGISSMLLGAGRATKEDSLDYGAGIELKKKTGDWVSKGDTLAVLYTSDEDRLPGAEERFLKSIHMEERQPEKENLIYAIIKE